MEKELSQYSREMAAQILEVYPEWQDVADIDTYNGETYFNLEITPPSNNVKAPLRIYTYGDEITVSFDSYHGHFYDLVNIDGGDAKTLIDQIISDNSTVVSYWWDDEWCGSMLLDSSDVPINNEEYPYANRIRIRTWSGRLDKDITCEPRG
ncbi:MAG: hypothetical protein JAZ15_14680 [Candidatus Thiodiazotropha endolucinida]|nr:hypothetical protein [Candidatus Thiodiazotropha taylori]MCW4314268.1 hypothetical protein [Candidatus Thiodiazotropha taylori]